MVSRICFAVSLLLALASPGWSSQRVVILTLSDSIQPASLRYLQHGLEAADASGAAVTILELNTPGGEVGTLRQMTTAITSARRPVVVFVSPSGAQAASAGFFLVMAADVAAMAPGTNTGAAHPVGGQGDLPRTLAKKITNDAAALVRSLATQRGRPADLAEKAVTQSLSWTERESLDAKLIDLVAIDRGELLRKLDGRMVRRFDGREEKLTLDAPELVFISLTLSDRVLSVVANPNIAYLLFLLGLLGFYVEITHPGAVFPGVLGGVSILLAFFGLSVLPVNYVGVLLILLGVVFFILEVKVASYGLLTTAGLASFILGSLMLIRSPFPALRVGLTVVLPTALAVAFVVIFLLTRVLKTQKRQPITGTEGMIGELGEVAIALEPDGKIFVHGEYWDATSRVALQAGAAVRVVRVDGKRLEVEPAGAEKPRPGA
ncbi:MAG: nodulation protein NfeD [Thermoanaerobaculales bacterium]